MALLESAYLYTKIFKLPFIDIQLVRARCTGLALQVCMAGGDDFPEQMLNHFVQHVARDETLCNEQT